MLLALRRLVNSESTGRGHKHQYFLQLPTGSDVQPSLRTTSQGDCVSVGMSEGEGWQKYWTRDNPWITKVSKDRQWTKNQQQNQPEPDFSLQETYTALLCS